jgi:Fe(3+) dicitrate transport protein
VNCIQILHFNNSRSLYLIVFQLLMFSIYSTAQTFTVSGRILDEQEELIADANVKLLHTAFEVKTDSIGAFSLANVPKGRYEVEVKGSFIERRMFRIQINNDTILPDVKVKSRAHNLEEVVIENNTESFGITRMKSVEGVAIYEGKKNEVILMKDVVANKAVNSSRQIFAKVPGMNIWESDAAGLQLGVATRGLDPNRTSNFNTRQNGYDMSADAIGYPDSYYVPPAEAVERIEVIRGAASLQYGPQFGGMLNYVLQRAPSNHKVEWTSYTTAGSYNLVSTFNSIAGTVKCFNYYGFYNYKQGESWRPNGKFNVHNAFASLGYKCSEKLSVQAEYTLSKYNTKQSGGLTDAQFDNNPKQSLRSRNWFSTNWNIFALSLNYKHSIRHQLNIRAWGFIGSRDALGFLGTTNRTDDITQNRDLISDKYKNFGTEARYMWKYFIGKYLSSCLIGARFYTGTTRKQQGLGDNGNNANYKFLNPDSLEGSDYRFPGMNVAVFTEHVFNLNHSIKITPGIRYEHIQTKASGYYRQTFFNQLDTIIKSETRSHSRNFVLLGLGFSWGAWRNTELYANVSQNYRGITFTDMRVVRVSQLVDPNLKDEKGFNVDIGYRGDFNEWLHWDASAFWLQYNNRIGQIQQVDSAYNIYRYTTNVGSSRGLGAEIFVEADLFKAAKVSHKAGNLALYATYGFTNATYVKSPHKNVVGKTLEFAPKHTLRFGVHYRYKQFVTSVQGQFVSSQFTDATNAKFTATGVNGSIPTYYTLDWSARYSFKCLQLIAGVNNFTNNIYFTRRAISYPGPGIIPAEPLTFFVTLGIKLNNDVKKEKWNTFQQ